MRRSKFLSTIISGVLILSSLVAGAQDNQYFIDGFHGGVYGHYPENYTRFLVDQLGEHKDWKLNLEIEPSTWDVIAVYEPVAYMEFREYANDTTDARRIEYVNPSFAQSYLYTCYGESMVRQFEYGIRKLKSHFPKMTFKTYSSEEPCFTSSLPTILSSFGIKYASTKCPNTCWGGYFTAYGRDLIDWVGPDGESSVMTVPRYTNEYLDTTTTYRTLASNMSREYIEAVRECGVRRPVGMCLQDAGWVGGPWLQGTGKNENGWNTLVNTKTIIWSEYFTKYSRGLEAERHTFTQEDVKPGLVWGSQVLQKLAQNVRQGENMILQAEKLASMSAIISGNSYPESDFDLAWENLLLSQHHDCWIVPYNQNRYKKTWAKQVEEWTANSNALSKKAEDSAFASICGNGNEIIVFNTSGRKREGLVIAKLPDNAGEFNLVDCNGAVVPYQLTKDGESISFIAEVPSFGYSTYSFKEGKNKSIKGARASIGRNGLVTLENESIRIILDPDRGGTFKSLKVNGKEILTNTSENRFNGLRGNFPNNGGFHTSYEGKARISIIESGPVRASVNIEGTIAGEPFKQKVSITKGSDIIDCTLQIDWKDSPIIGKYDQKDIKLEKWNKAFYNDYYKLHLTFPTIADGGRLFKDAPFDVCETKEENTFFDSWGEIKHNVILDWVDLEGGNGLSLGLLCDHTDTYLYGKDHPLGLNVQYIGKGLWGRDYTVAGPTKIHYALVPHTGTWETVSLISQEWNEPLMAANGSSKGSESLLDMSGTSYQLVSASMKDGDLYLRIYNAGGNNSKGTVKMNMGYSKASLVEMDGRPKENLENAGQVTLDIPKFGIRTLKLENTTLEQ